MRADVAHSLRSLGRRPGFTGVVLCTIALAIAANTMMFSVVYGVLLRPLPYRDADALVMVDSRAHTGDLVSVSMPNYRDWREANRVFSAVTASAPWRLTLRGQGDPQRVEGRVVVDDFFGTLGLAAARGRVIAADEAPAHAGGAGVAVVGHRFWTEKLGARADVLGMTLTLGNRPYTIVGVLPPHAGFPTPEVEVYVPMSTIPGLPWDDRTSGFGGSVLARLAPGRSLDAARSDAARLGAALRDAHGAAIAVPEVRWLRDEMVGDVRARLWLLMGAVTFVLLIAAANVGNLLLAAGEQRHRELAVRSALGAGRRDLVRLLLAEALVLGVAGGAIGVALAYAGVGAMASLLPAQIPGAMVWRVRVDALVAAWGFVLAIGTVVLFALAPLSRVARRDTLSALKSGTRSVGGDRRGVREALVVSEIALAVVLLVGSGLMVRSLQRLVQVDKGFRAEHVLAASVAPPERAPTNEQWLAFNDALLERARALPGVRSAAVALLLPLSDRSWELLAHPEGVPVRAETGTSVLYNMVSPDYFATLGVPVVRGRAFTPADREGAGPVAIVDETMAARFWPGIDPLGKHLTFEEDSAGAPVYRTVVGVTRNVRHYELTAPSRVQVYVPVAQALRRWGQSLNIAVRTSGPPAPMSDALRRALLEVEPQAVVAEMRPLGQNVETALGGSTAIARVLGAFALAALLLAAVGIFGVMSYTVARRTREIGVRVALGAAPSDVTRWVVGRAARLTLAGVALGVAGAIACSTILRHLLFEVSVFDPATFVVAVSVLAAIGVLAALLPARRAARVDPVTALARDE